MLIPEGTRSKTIAPVKFEGSVRLSQSSKGPESGAANGMVSSKYSCAKGKEIGVLSKSTRRSEVLGRRKERRRMVNSPIPSEETEGNLKFDIREMALYAGGSGGQRMREGRRRRSKKHFPIPAIMISPQENSTNLVSSRDS